MATPAEHDDSLQSCEDGEQQHVPPFHSRLSKLRPSRALLEYYRQKISQYDSERDEILGKLQQHKFSSEELHKKQWELQLREDEISQLQQALSDMQVFLFQEREHVLRLYAENDRLKIRELEDRRRIQHLLSLTVPISGETTYFHKEPPAKVLVVQHRAAAQDSQRPAVIRSQSAINGRGPGGHKKKTTEEEREEFHDKETLLLTVESLKAQLEEQTRLCKEQVDALLEDRRVRLEEAESRRVKDIGQLKAVADQLQNTRGLLYDSTKDYLDLKYDLRAKERSWMDEKDELIRELDKCREQLSTSSGGGGGGGGDSLLNFSSSEGGPVFAASSQRKAQKQLQQQLKQTQQLADHYREQTIKAEEQVARLKEENDMSKRLFKERTERVAKRLELMNSRYENLEKRRALEGEGYKNDIKILRQRLGSLEKQLYKMTLTLNGNQDMEILEHVRKTAKSSKKIVGDLQNLKAKVYSMENSFRHVHDHD